MTAKEAAEYLKLHYMTLYRLSKQGRIPASRIGGNWRYRKDLLDDWLANQATLAHGSVLVVDDDPEICKVLSEIIGQEGYKAVCVGSGEEALEQAKGQHYDLIFLDLLLPGMSGVEAFTAIKEVDEKAVVVIVTAYGDEPIATEAMSLGPLFLVRKPFRVKDIVEVLDIVLKAK
jgi:excisionase family DNA binding protein